MKNLIILLFSICLCSSCIEEFTDLPSGADEKMLVVEGEVVSGQFCMFQLRHTAPLGADSKEQSLELVEGYVALESSDGTRYPGTSFPGVNGIYFLQVPDLDPNDTYRFCVSAWGYGDFYTPYMRPEPVPDIEKLYFDIPHEDGVVNIHVSTSGLTEPSYLLWTFDEYWEIQTPMRAMYYFDPETEKILPNRSFADHGWVTRYGRERILATNADYGNQDIKGIRLFQRNKQDFRFRTRYLTHVRQTAISAEEYEYLRLLKKQSSEVGGIFTSMPSELPSNLVSTQGKKAIGYVGIRSRVVERDLYIKSSEVGHRDHVLALIEPQEKRSNLLMHQLGYVPFDYNEFMKEAQWCERWATDCREPYWGGDASLEKPSIWEYEY